MREEHRHRVLGEWPAVWRCSPQSAARLVAWTAWLILNRIVQIARLKILNGPSYHVRSQIDLRNGRNESCDENDFGRLSPRSIRRNWWYDCLCFAGGGSCRAVLLACNTWRRLRCRFWSSRQYRSLIVAPVSTDQGGGKRRCTRSFDAVRKCPR